MPITRRSFVAGALVVLSPIPSAFAGFPAPSMPLGTAHDGRRLTGADLGGWTLFYFGYTHCPDVCPTSLLTVAEAMDALGAVAAKVTPVFVTVDPARDTPEVLAGYVGSFHPRLVGLTPTEEALAVFAGLYKVKWAKVDQGASHPYLMDHSASLYLGDPNGQPAGKFAHGLPGAKIAAKIAEVIARTEAGRS